MFIGGLFLLVAGFYVRPYYSTATSPEGTIANNLSHLQGSVVSIRDAFNTGIVGRPFSCTLKLALRLSYPYRVPN